MFNSEQEYVLKVKLGGETTEYYVNQSQGTLKAHWGLGVRFKPSENAARENVF